MLIAFSFFSFLKFASNKDNNPIVVIFRQQVRQGKLIFLLSCLPKNLYVQKIQHLLFFLIYLCWSIDRFQLYYLFFYPICSYLKLCHFQKHLYLLMLFHSELLYIYIRAIAFEYCHFEKSTDFFLSSLSFLPSPLCWLLFLLCPPP